MLGEYVLQSASQEAAQSLDLRSEIMGIDFKVSLLDGSCRTYAYLDNAASTPCFRVVWSVLERLVETYSSVHRGAGFKSLLMTEAYEAAREMVLRFVAADPREHTAIFVKNTTEAINKAANRLDLRPDDVIVTSGLEHHSNDLPWRPKAQVVYVGLDHQGALDIEHLEALLERYQRRVRLVAISAASNVTGFVTPLDEVAQMAHQHGALVLADCAQLAPHRAVTMRSLSDPRHLDFVALSAHKMYAPFGSGVLVGPIDFFRQGPPDIRGGGTVELVNLDEVHWSDPPSRDEAGTPNVLGAAALAASMRFLSNLGMDAIAAHENLLTQHALERLQGIAGLHLYGSPDPARTADRLGVIPLSVDQLPHGLVAAILAFEHGIGVRSGCFCAHPYVLRLLQVDPARYQEHRAAALAGDRSQLPGIVRVSFGCYNNIEEIDRLIHALKQVARQHYAGDYVVDRHTGAYLPRGFDPASLRAQLPI